MQQDSKPERPEVLIDCLQGGGRRGPVYRADGTYQKSNNYHDDFRCLQRRELQVCRPYVA